MNEVSRLCDTVMRFKGMCIKPRRYNKNMSVSFSLLYSMFDFCPHHLVDARSCQASEAKQGMAWSAPGWEPAGEELV